MMCPSDLLAQVKDKAGVLLELIILVVVFSVIGCPISSMFIPSRESIEIDHYMIMNDIENLKYGKCLPVLTYSAEHSNDDMYNCLSGLVGVKSNVDIYNSKTMEAFDSNRIILRLRYGKDYNEFVDKYMNINLKEELNNIRGDVDVSIHKKR